MGMTDLVRYRLEKAVRKLCQARNQNTPAELGKAQYEINHEGAIFSKLCFLLDSSHINYECTVAKLVFVPTTQEWQLYIAERETDGSEVTGWFRYPYLPPGPDIEEQIAELLHDPQNLIW